MRHALAFVLLSALPATAQDTMSASEFEAYVTGKTLTYSYSGEEFGTEQYLPDRKVRWAFTKDECKDGYWFEDSGKICFVYEDDGALQCWTFWQTPTGLKALFEGDDATTELSEVEQSTGPLSCAGPDVGA